MEKGRIAGSIGELVGHTPLEVAGGALTGLLVAVIYLLILFA